VMMGRGRLISDGRVPATQRHGPCDGTGTPTRHTGHPDEAHWAPRYDALGTLIRRTGHTDELLRARRRAATPRPLRHNGHADESHRWPDSPAAGIPLRHDRSPAAERTHQVDSMAETLADTLRCMAGTLADTVRQCGRKAFRYTLTLQSSETCAGVRKCCINQSIIKSNRKSGVFEINIILYIYII